MTRETDLYNPVKRFLEERGFRVNAEVKGADLVARQDDNLVIVELKRAFSLDLLLQGVERQTIAADVYLAIAEPSGRTRGSPRWRAIQRLCRLLGLGLLSVRLSGVQNRVSHHADVRPDAVNVVLEPAAYRPRRSGRKRAALLKEIDARSGDHNVGGSSRRPLVTAYREETLRLAHRVNATGTATVRELRAEALSPRAANILQMNAYGWFDRVERGRYRLTPAGQAALETYAHVIATYVLVSRDQITQDFGAAPGTDGGEKRALGREDFSGESHHVLDRDPP